MLLGINFFCGINQSSNEADEISSLERLQKREMKRWAMAERVSFPDTWPKSPPLPCLRFQNKISFSDVPHDPWPRNFPWKKSNFFPGKFGPTCRRELRWPSTVINLKSFELLPKTDFMCFITWNWSRYLSGNCQLYKKQWSFLRFRPSKNF